MARIALPIQPPFVCVALLNRKKSRVRLHCCTECCTVCLSLLCLPLRSRSPHNAQHFTSYARSTTDAERDPEMFVHSPCRSYLVFEFCACAVAVNIRTVY